jgi:hypothetical protein
MPPFNIFISWAGTTSRKLAVAVHEWLPMVIQNANPFVSNKDIDAGARGLPEIASQLKSIQLGLICLTADNQSSPWLNFEAGAISKVIEETYVIPLAFDIDKGQIKQPLGQFQAMYFTQEDMLHTIGTVNKALGHQLTEARLTAAFELTWPLLLTKIEKIKAEEGQGSFVDEPKRSTEEMLEELVVSMREQGTLLRKLDAPPRRGTIMQAQFTVTETALRKLGEIYTGKDVLTMQEAVEMAPKFDQEDWRIVATSPYLLWFLTEYHGIYRPDPPSETLGGSDIDDVPF